MSSSSLGRVLEIFFGGNTRVDAAVLFDTGGETIDYHCYIDPFTARLIAAHSGILFELARYKMAWMDAGAVDTIEVSAVHSDFVISAVCEEYLLLVVVKGGAMDEGLSDTIAASIEVLRKEIGC